MLIYQSGLILLPARPFVKWLFLGKAKDLLIIQLTQVCWLAYGTIHPRFSELVLPYRLLLHVPFGSLASVSY